MDGNPELCRHPGGRHAQHNRSADQSPGRPNRSAISASMEVDCLSTLASSLSLAPSDVVVIVGLVSQRQHNFRAARVVTKEQAGSRVGVRLLHGERKSLSVRRQNLLRASHEQDRKALLVRIVLQRQRELRVCRDFLLDQLSGEEGLLLHIASFFPPRETMALTTGFAMGKIVPAWVCATLDEKRGALTWRRIHDGRECWDQTGPSESEHAMDDGIVRIDCAVVDIGSGQFLVAGGCADHPSRARAFFSSAFMYDSITHVATALPDMPHPRHGCKGAYLDGKVYVVGGDYAAYDHEQRAFCCVFDLLTRRWSNLRAPLEPRFRTELQRVAFCPVGAIDGRLVLYHAGKIFALNPQQPEIGWLVCGNDNDPNMEPVLGNHACEGTAWGRHFIVSTGRGGSERCHVGAFSFIYPPTATVAAPVPQWTVGQWSDLGETGPTGRVGCGLAVVHNRIYVSGGVNESLSSGGAFDGSVACWTGTLNDLPTAPSAAELADEQAISRLRTQVVNCKRPWQRLEGLDLPVAMHAHHAITIPWLPVTATSN